METMTIGRIARLSGVGVETVRFYERQGLIDEPPRRPSGYRQYPEEAVTNLRFIQGAKRLGFTLKEIKELLALRRHPGTPAAEVKRQAEAKITDIQRRIKSLQKMKKALMKLTSACRHERTTGECPLLNALGSDDEVV